MTMKREVPIIKKVQALFVTDCFLLEIYQEIYATMQKIQELDLTFNAAKLRFYLDMEGNYEKMSDKLISQCNDLSQEKEEYRKKIRNGTGTIKTVK